MTTLKAIAEEIGVLHIAYLRFSSDKSSDTSLLTGLFTYSREWQARYFLKQYVTVDPVISRGRQALLPFDWETLIVDDPAIMGFFSDALNHNVGRNGISIPVRSRKGAFSVVSFSSNDSRLQWEAYKAKNMVKLQLLSVLIDSAANINSKLPAAPVSLSRREEQCLIWAARGKTYQEIGDILNLTFGSVKNSSGCGAPQTSLHESDPCRRCRGGDRGDSRQGSAGGLTSGAVFQSGVFAVGREGQNFAPKPLKRLCRVQKCSPGRPSIIVDNDREPSSQQRSQRLALRPLCNRPDFDADVSRGCSVALQFRSDCPGAFVEISPSGGPARGAARGRRRSRSPSRSVAQRPRPRRRRSDVLARSMRFRANPAAIGGTS